MHKSTALAEARTLLFVPGNRPERFDKALHSGADAIVLDLEDAVPLPQKAVARQAIARALPALASAAIPVVVRINGIDQAEGREDLSWLAEQSGVTAVMVPKAASAAGLRQVFVGSGGLPLLPLIESAAGHAALPEISAVQGVLRLVIGHLDFMADTGIQCAEDEAELAPLRFAVAMATRLQRLASAIDGVTADIHDAGRLTQDTARSLRFGFGGKLCIHPGQVAIVHACLAPGKKEIDWAARVLAADRAAAGSAVQLDGRMIDLPVVLQARRTLARARRVGQ